MNVYAATEGGVSICVCFEWDKVGPIIVCVFVFLYICIMATHVLVAPINFLVVNIFINEYRYFGNLGSSLG